MKSKRAIILITLLLIESFAGAQGEGLRFSKEPLAAGGSFDIYDQWQVFYVKDGLPDDHIFTIEADGDRLWVGTENGLALFRDNKWQSWQEKDGLPWKVVSDIAVSKETGDVWLALFGGGIARFSGGRFDHFNQFNSGLVNDVVYGIAVSRHTVWAATTAGISRYDTISGQWEIYTDKNAPMEEIWCYNVDADKDKVYIAVWGGGVLEWDVSTKKWNAHRDPDRQMEIDLYRDDGLIHNITTAVSYNKNVLWASTYFGLSRYDGRNWRGYMDHDSGLPSNFINYTLARNNTCYNATDKGLAALVDFKTNTWVTYRKEKPMDKTWTAFIMKDNNILKEFPTDLNLPNDHVIAFAFQGDQVWIGTGHGLARSTSSKKKFLRSFLQKATPRRAAGGITNKQSKYARTPEQYKPFGKFHQPYKNYFLEPLEYTGYGRQLTSAPLPETVKIGFLGPIEPTVSVATGGSGAELGMGKKMLQGAQLAVQQANQRGGFIAPDGTKIPYQLIVHNDNGLWGASGNEIIDLAYNKNVWAILGTIDGANSHIAIRAALKAEIPMMNTADTDPTFTETAIPWVFRVITDDRQMCYMLADYVFKTLKLTRVAALRANNRYGRIGIGEFRDAATRMGHPFIVELNYPGDAKDFTTQLQRIKSLNPQVIITYGDARQSALILKQMRAMGMNQWFIGSDRMVSAQFIQLAGQDIGNIAAGYPYNPQINSPLLKKFRQQFKQQYKETAESYAAHAYDGMNIMLQAIQAAGLNRAMIRDQLAAVKHYKGVTGAKEFDATYNNISPPALALYKNGKWQFLSSPQKRTAAVVYKDMKEIQRSINVYEPETEPLETSALESIPIGLFSPSHKVSARQMNNGVAQAIQDANKKGGYKGIPFQILHRWAKEPWAAGSKEVIDLVYGDHVRAIITYREGAGHIAQQIAAKAHLPVVAPLSSSQSLLAAQVPWTFRLPPDDIRNAQRMVTRIKAHIGLKRIGIVSGTDHDSRAAASAIEKKLNHVAFHLQVPFNGLDKTQLRRLSLRIRDFAPDGLVIVALAQQVSPFVNTLKQEKVACPLFIPHAADAYRYGYYAAKMIISAIRSNGLNRSAIARYMVEKK